MTNGEAMMLENDAVIFQANGGREDRRIDVPVEPVENIKFEQATKTGDIKSRFARLKKSLRKRSVSIL